MRKNSFTCYALFMKTLIFLIGIHLFASFSWGGASELRTLVKLKNDGHQNLVIQEDSKNIIPTRIKDSRIREIMQELPPGTEAFIEGHIEYDYQKSDNTGSMHPFFVIEAIHPVSLKEIGNIGRVDITQDSQNIFSNKAALEPFTIPVTTEVASALTMTTGFLLMESLTTEGDPDGRRDLRKAMIISSGMMATLLFIYEQIEGKTKP